MHLPSGFIRFTTIGRTMDPDSRVLIVLLWATPTLIARGVSLQVFMGNDVTLPGWNT
jgi:hypothetical protein